MVIIISRCAHALAFTAAPLPPPPTMTILYLCTPNNFSSNRRMLQPGCVDLLPQERGWLWHAWMSGQRYKRGAQRYKDRGGKGRRRKKKLLLEALASIVRSSFLSVQPLFGWRQKSVPAAAAKQTHREGHIFFFRLFSFFYYMACLAAYWNVYLSWLFRNKVCHCSWF